MNKRSSFIFAIFDLYLINNYMKIAVLNLCEIKSCFQSSLYLPAFISILQVIFIFSVLVSGIFYIFNLKIAYFMYFPQFVLRILFVMPTFGIILKPFSKNAGSNLYKLLLVICGILEIGRLIATIKCLVKNNKRVTD